MELEPVPSPPNALVWIPDWIPPRCTIACQPGCDALYGITVYFMTLYRGVARTNPKTLKPEKRDIIAASANEFYFDKYGCRRNSGAPFYYDPRVLASVSLFLPHNDAKETRDYWFDALDALRQSGAPAPGHVRLLPKWKDALTRLAILATLDDT